MKKFWQTLLCTLLCAFLGLSVTACDGDGSSDSGQKKGPAEIILNDYPTEMQSGENTELTFLLIYDMLAEGEMDTNVSLTYECTDGNVSMNFQQLNVKQLAEDAWEAVYLMSVVGSGEVTVIATSTCGNGNYRFDVFVLGAGEHRCMPDAVQIENEVEAECGVAGSYDEVIRCIECGEIIEKTTYTTDPKEHEERDYPETENEVFSTCQEYGSYDEVYYCRHCGEEMSRERKDYTYLGSCNGNNVQEETLVAPTCTTGGTSQIVRYCTVCGEEHSRGATNALGALHTMVNDVCTLCGARESSAGLEVDTYFDDTTGMLKYIVRSLGTCEAKDVIIDAYQGHPISAIDAEAFKNAKFSSVTFGKSVETIYRDALYGCNSLQKIVFEGAPKLLKGIVGSWSSVTPLDLYVPTLESWLSVNTDGGEPLGGCQYNLYVNNAKLTELVIPATCTTVPSNRFVGCHSIQKVTLSEGVAEVGENAFYACINLTAVDFPSTLRIIGGGAFAITTIETIELNEGLQTLGNSAFADYQVNIKSLKIPSTAISTDAFTFHCYSNYNIEKVYISNVANWCKYFANTGKFAQELYIGNGEDPAKTIEVPTGVTEILPYTFAFGHITSVKLPEGVQTIRQYVFEGAKELASVTLPSTLKTIEKCAFNSCKKLDGVILPSGLETIGDYAFQGCEALQAIDIPDSVTKMYDEEGFTFVDCTALKTVTIGKGVTVIPTYAFGRCSSLSSLTLGENVQTIQAHAFIECALTQLSIPNKVVTIESYAFSQNGSLATLSLGNQLKTIGDHAFSICGELQSVDIPDSVEKIGWSAFSRCAKLATVTIGSGVKYIGEYAFQLCALTSVDFDTNTSGWYRTTNETATSGINTDLSDPAQAAKYLLTDYVNYYFKRN